MPDADGELNAAPYVHFGRGLSGSRIWNDPDNDGTNRGLGPLPMPRDAWNACCIDGVVGYIVSRRAPLRLPADAYSDTLNAFSITICTQQRERVFEDRALARAGCSIVEEHAKATAVTLWAYCLMPDHVHLLLTASPRCDVVRFTGQFKSLVARASWPLGYQSSFWQPRFWDESVPFDKIPAAAAYILENPVRAGLVQRAEDYEFSGPRRRA